MQADTGIVERIEEAGIGTGHDRDAGLLQHRQHGGDLVVFLVAGLDLRGRRLGRALDAPGIGRLQFRSDVGQVRIVAMIVLVEEVQDAAAIEGRGHEHPLGREATVGGHGGIGIEAGIEACGGLRAVDALGREVRGDAGFILDPGLVGIVQMFDGTDAGIDGLLHSQRHRNMPGRPQPVGTRSAHRGQEQLRRQRAVGDLDEVDTVALEAHEGRIQVGLRAHFEGALPDRLDAFDLGARGEQLRAGQLAAGDLATPLQHLLGEIARGVTDGGDAMGDVQRQQRLVLFDERRPTAEVHMHVPQPGDQVAPLAVHLLPGLPCLAHGPVAAHRDDVLAPHDDSLVGPRGGVLHVDDGGMADHQIGLLGRERGGGQCKQHRNGKTQGHGQCTGK